MAYSKDYRKRAVEYYHEDIGMHKFRWRSKSARQFCGTVRTAMTQACPCKCDHLTLWWTGFE